jgi:hypothetical protein
LRPAASLRTVPRRGVQAAEKKVALASQEARAASVASCLPIFGDANAHSVSST